MRTTLIAGLVVLLSVAYGYYQQHPDDRAKLFAQVSALLGGASSGTPAQTTDVTPDSSGTTQGAISDPSATPDPVKAWIRPSVIPAQPNWTWTTTDGKTYQDVVITDINPTTVTITHSIGVAHLDISTLPATIQEQLNYDPTVAASIEAAAKSESMREENHPYYTMASLSEAQAAARQLHWPLAWVDSNLSDLSVSNPAPGSEAEATQMAMSYLKGRAVIIFLDGGTDLGTLSPVVRDQQLFQYDDVNVPPPHHFYTPKIAFTDAEISKPLGRVSYTQMKADGEAAIGNVLQSISE